MQGRYLRHPFLCLSIYPVVEVSLNRYCQCASNSAVIDASKGMKAKQKAVYNCELVATFSKSVPLRLRKGSSHV
jgi:hypothetical protein